MIEILGEEVPDRFVVVMLVALLLLVLEARAWILMDRREKEDKNR